MTTNGATGIFHTGDQKTVSVVSYYCRGLSDVTGSLFGVKFQSLGSGEVLVSSRRFPLSLDRCGTSSTSSPSGRHYEKMDRGPAEYDAGSTLDS